MVIFFSEESTHDRGGSLPALYKRREVALMTAFEIVMVVLGVHGLIASFGVVFLALLTYIDRNNERK